MPLNFIPESYYDKTFIVTRKGEQEELYSSYKDKVNVLSLDCNNISSKRDAICRHFAGEKIWMIDDDCLLYNTVLVDYVNSLGQDDTNIKLTDPVTEKDFYDFIDYVNELLDEYPHGIVRPNLFSRGKNYLPYRLNTWAFTNALLNLKTIDADFLEYNFSSHSEDVVAFLNIIEKGHQSFCLSKWMLKSERPGKPGGMTEIRTSKMISEASIKIHEKFPDHTRVKKGYPLKDGTIPITLVIKPKVKKKAKPSSTLENFL